MDAYETAVELLNYFSSARQVGHTRVMLEGANDKDCIIVDRTIASRHLEGKVGKAKLIALTQIAPGTLAGYKKPLVLDNGALHSLLGELVGTIAAQRRSAQELNDKIRLAKAILQ